MLLINLLIYIASFILIWFGSGLIINSASIFSKKLKLSTFAFSFVFLGILTSTPEFSVGLQAVADHNANIFVGNLLGGIIVLFLVVIPLLAIFGNGISLKHELTNRQLIFTSIVIIAPSLLILDKKVTNLEGIFMIILYSVLLFIVQKENGIFDKNNNQILDLKAYSFKDLLKIIIGLAIVFISSYAIVNKTLYFSNFFNISAFYVSLIIVSLGTNLPELTIAIRSILSGKKDIAMGDYMGSAAANTLLFGIFTLLHNGEVLTISNFFTTFIFIFIALLIFNILSYKYKYISRFYGIVLLCIYLLFIIFELK